MTSDRIMAKAADPRDLDDFTVEDPDHSARFPSVASQFASKDRAGLLIGGGIAGLLGMLTFVMLANGRVPGDVPRAAASEAAQQQADPLGLSPPAAAQPAAGQPAAAPAQAAAPALSVLPPAQPPLALQVAQPAGVVDRSNAPAVIYDVAASGQAGLAPQTAPAPAVQPKQRQNAAGLTPEEQFAARLVDGGVEQSSASRLGNLSSLVAQGTLIYGVLETAIDTDVPGYVRAVISRDVRSFDGSRVLIPRGSRVIGQYKSGLAIGQTRAYVIWTRIIRPDGVSITLSSPATDSSGRNGLSGKVDSHFGKRFGAAILLSLIGAAGQVASSGTSVVLAGPQAAMSQTASSNMNIPPTVRIALGQPIRIFTAQDLDFSAVSP